MRRATIQAKSLHEWWRHPDNIEALKNLSIPRQLAALQDDLWLLAYPAAAVGLMEFLLDELVFFAMVGASPVRGVPSSTARRAFRSLLLAERLISPWTTTNQIAERGEDLAAALRQRAESPRALLLALLAVLGGWAPPRRNAAQMCLAVVAPDRHRSAP